MTVVLCAHDAKSAAVTRRVTPDGFSARGFPTGR
jgi:hypothetical protein